MKNLIAITTFNRPDLLQFTLLQVNKYKDSETIVYVIDDGSEPTKATENKELFELYNNNFNYEYQQNKGIATAKNKCLEFAKKIKADYILLLDDDTFLTKKGVFDYLIDIHLKTKENHFLISSIENCVLKSKNEHVSIYENNQGICYFLTRKVINYNIKFPILKGGYGYEHTMFSILIKHYKLNSEVSIEPNNLREYVSSFHFGDYENYLKDNNIEFTCSLPLNVRNESILKNQIEFQNFVRKYAK